MGANVGCWLSFGDMEAHWVLFVHVFFFDHIFANSIKRLMSPSDRQQHSLVITSAPQKSTMILEEARRFRAEAQKYWGIAGCG